MRRKCNVHIKELFARTNALFKRIGTRLQLSYTLTTHTCWNLTPLTSESTFGEQIKYYRRLNDVKQTDLGIKLNFERSTLNHLENHDIKLVNVNLIKGIIKELDIEDKININDDYINFLLDNPCEKIRQTRKKMKLTLEQFGNLLGVSDTSVRRWEHGNHQISRKKYERLKDYI